METYRNIVFIGGANLYKQVENWVEDIDVTKYDNVFDIGCVLKLC